MANDWYAQPIPSMEWTYFLPWEEDEIIATYIIPHVESVRRAPQRLWHEGRCYIGLGPADSAE